MIPDSNGGNIQRFRDSDIMMLRKGPLLMRRTGWRSMVGYSIADDLAWLEIQIIGDGMRPISHEIGGYVGVVVAQETIGCSGL